MDEWSIYKELRPEDELMPEDDLYYLLCDEHRAELEAEAEAEAQASNATPCDEDQLNYELDEDLENRLKKIDELFGIPSIAPRGESDDLLPF